MSDLPESWNVAGYFVKSNKILTCYGLEEKEAHVIASLLRDSGLVYKIDLNHVWRERPRGRWQRKTHQWPMEATTQRPAVIDTNHCVAEAGVHSRRFCSCRSL